MGITRSQFKSAITEIQKALRVKDEFMLDKHQIDIYYKYLKDLTKNQLDTAVEIIIKTDEIFYFPHIGRIRRAAGANVGMPPSALSLEDIQQMTSLDEVS